MALVLWSGGCDSTMALLALLKDSPMERIRTLSIRHPQFGAAREKLKARDELQKAMRGYYGYEFDRIELTIDHKGGEIQGLAGGQQPVTWLTLGSLYAHPTENVHAGYIRGDSFWMASHTQQEAFRQHQEVQGKTGQLVLPGESWTRADVLLQLKAWRLLDLCWWCESPAKARGRKTTQCGRCDPCLNHGAGQWILDQKAKQENRT